MHDYRFCVPAHGYLIYQFLVSLYVSVYVFTPCGTLLISVLLQFKLTYIIYTPLLLNALPLKSRQ